MPKTYSENAAINNIGIARLLTYCAEHKPPLICRLTPNDDIGLDGEIEICDEKGRPTGSIIKIQLKTTKSDDSYISSEKDGKFTYRADPDDLDYWKSVTNEVVLIVCDARGEDERVLYARRIEKAETKSTKTKTTPLAFIKEEALLNEKIERDFIDRFLGAAEKRTRRAKLFPPDFIPRLDYFVGRERLLFDIESQLSREKRVSLHNFHGIGKTFTTYRYALRSQTKYEKIFFIDAAKGAWMKSMAEAAEFLSPDLKDREEKKSAKKTDGQEEESRKKQSDKVEFLRKWLAEKEGYLVIFDNVDELSEFKKYLPNNPLGELLFTSNLREIADIAKGIKIKTLTKEESRHLLYARSDPESPALFEFVNEQEESAFGEIIRLIDGLPIALVAAGSSIRKMSRSGFSRYHKKFVEEPDVVLDEEEGRNDYRHKTALKAFVIAFEELTNLANCKPDSVEAIATEAVKEVLFVSSLLAPDDIPEEFLRSYLERYFEAYSGAKDKEELWCAVLDRMHSYHLLENNAHLESFSTHRLIQKCIFSRLDEAGKIAYAEKVLNLLRDFFPLYDYNNKLQCEKYYQHTLAALDNADKVGFEAEVSDSLYFRVGSYQQDIGNYGQAEKFYSRSLEISRKVYGEEHTETATGLNNLAGVYEAQGKYDEAIGLYKEAVEIGEKTIGKEHPDYATSLNNLAAVYYSQGKYDEAIGLYKEAMEIDKKIYGEDHPDYAIDLNNLAGVYQAQGKYDEAIGLFKEATEITGKALGKDHPDYATRLNNLALVYDSQGKYEEAIGLYKEATEITGKALGKEHPDYATRLNNLAGVYRAQGKYDEAIGLYEQSKEIRRKTLGEDHPDYAASLNNLAWVYRDQEKYSEALPLFEEALRIWEAKLPPEHPYIVDVKIIIEICKGKI